MRTGIPLDHVVRQTDRAILRAPDRETMFRETCEIAVEGGLRMAWIAVPEPGSDWLRPASSAGDTTGYLATVRVAANPQLPEGRGPTGTAAATGRATVVDDLRTDPAFAPWRDAALAAGYRSVAALPLYDEEVVGVLTVYHEEPGVFDPEALRHLDALAEDVSLGLRVQRSSAARLEAEQRFRRLYERSIEGIFRTTVDGRPVEVNPALARMLGYDDPEQVLAEVTDIREQLYAVPGARDEVLRQMREHGELTAHEIPIRRRDGTPLWLAMTARYLTLAEDGMDGLEGMVVDVTARHRAIEAQERRDAILQAVSDIAELLLRPDHWEELIDEVLAALGRGTRTSRVALMRIWTDAEGTLYGGEPRSWAVDPTYDLTDAGALQVVPFEAAGYGRWARTLQADEPIVGLARDFPASERPLLDAFGVRSVALVPVLVEEELWGWLGFDDCETDREYSTAELDALRAAARILAAAVARDRDRARLVDARDDLTRYTTELERSNQELEQFAYVVSHDLQEPLRMVTSFLGLLERRYDGELDDTAREFIAFAVDGARRQQRMISDLLAYSRVNTRAAAPRPTSLDEALGAALGNLHSAIESAGAVVHGPTHPVWLLVDATQLAQVLQNLVGNALRFRGDHRPEITLDARRGDDTWELTVTDNGIGIPAEHRERVFEIFQRLHTREEYDGTGIGLAICRRVAERHGGRIWVDDAPGGGAVFHITLPAADEP